MITILKGKTKEVTINTEGPVTLIGECINPTRRKKLIASLQEEKFDYILELAKDQIDAFADILDVNVGYPGVDDEKLLPEIVKIIEDNFDIPLCLDSPNPNAIEAALKVSKGKCLINSVNGEEKSLSVMLPIAKEYGAAIIGLVMDENGITYEPGKRLAIAEKIVNRAVNIGIPEEDIIIDPLAMAVSADPRACIITLETIKLVRDKLKHNITLGLSNISFGLPGREYINSAFAALAINAGLTCPIANPEKIIAIIRAIDLILDRDDYAMRYIEAARIFK